MAKKVTANLKMKIPAGKASAAPPVGSTLGQYGVNMMDFVNPFNEQTREMKGTVVAHIAIYDLCHFALLASQQMTLSAKNWA